MRAALRMVVPGATSTVILSIVTLKFGVASDIILWFVYLVSALQMYIKRRGRKEFAKIRKVTYLDNLTNY